MNARIAGALLFLGAPAFSQHFMEAGVKIGVPVSDSFETGSFSFLATGFHSGSSATRRYVVGAGVVVRLTHYLGAESDILYRRLGYDIWSSSPTIPVVSQHAWTTANSWEFPLLGIYRPPRLLHLTPRISAGVSFRAVSGAATATECVPQSAQYASLCVTTAPQSVPEDERLRARSAFGGTFGAAVETRAGPIRLTPEIRYTRWRADTGSGGPLFDLRSNPSQIDFLLGVSF